MELWDAYYQDGTPAGFDLIRGKSIPDGIFHLVCEAVIRHRDGDYLLMRRSLQKEVFPGYWEIGAGGSALKGESPIQGVLREVREETGISGGTLTQIYRRVHEQNHSIYFGYLLETACQKNAVQLQAGETIDYQWISEEHLIRFFNSEDCIPSLKERLKVFINSIR